MQLGNGGDGHIAQRGPRTEVELHKERGDLGFSASDRAESVRRASEVAGLFNEAGVITMVTLISPYRKDRDEARRKHQARGLPFLRSAMLR